MTLVQPAGKAKAVPAFLFVAILLGAFSLAHAAPPEEKFPEVGKPQLDREPTVLEQAVDRAAVMLLNDKLPANEDGVRFALWLYGEKGDVAYLDVATKMAREFVKTDSTMGTAALYWVAQAGGPTLEEAKAIEESLWHAGTNQLVWIAGLSAKHEKLAVEIKGIIVDYGRYPPDEEKTITETIELLRVQAEFAQFFGNSFFDNFTSLTLKRFWEPQKSQFRDVAASDPMVYRDSARMALALWQLGEMYQNKHFQDIGRKTVESSIEAAFQHADAVAILGLAAGRLSHHPLHIAIVGDPTDSLVTALRQAAYFVFEPNKVVINLDPAKDAERMKELLYPAEAAPALFVCVETLCSPPVRDPAQVEKQVAEIKKLAAQIEQ